MKKISLFVLLALLVLSLSVWATGQQSDVGMAEKITLHMMSHRYPALEFYAEELQKAAPPNVRVETELMPYDQFIEKMRINLAGGSDVASRFAPPGGVAPDPRDAIVPVCPSGASDLLPTYVSSRAARWSGERRRQSSFSAPAAFA